jgi:hypothetical protein
MTTFEVVYDQPDPRAYFRALSPYAYQTPQHAQGIVRRLLLALARKDVRDASPITVLDVCSSYAINAALLNYNLTLEDLYEHYTSDRASMLSTAELVEWDRDFYASRRRPDAYRVIGLDAAPNAIDYARAVGLVDQGFAEDLEATTPSSGLLRAAKHAALITVTGGPPFPSPHTFQTLVGATGPIWVAAFALRTAPYEPVADCLTRYGLITERGHPTFPQRRFTSLEEQEYAIQAVTAAGEDPDRKETNGYFHTAFHLSRPAEDVAAFPLAALVEEG